MAFGRLKKLAKGAAKGAIGEAKKVKIRKPVKRLAKGAANKVTSGARDLADAAYSNLGAGPRMKKTYKALKKGFERKQ